MTAKEGIYKVLSNIFNGELYPVHHPDPDGLYNSVSDDFAIYTKVGENTFNTLIGVTAEKQVRIQVSIYSVNHDKNEQLVTFMNQAMIAANDVFIAAHELGNDPYETEGALANRPIPGSFDDFDNESRRFVTHSDFYVWSRD